VFSADQRFGGDLKTASSAPKVSFWPRIIERRNVSSRWVREAPAELVSRPLHHRGPLETLFDMAFDFGTASSVDHRSRGYSGSRVPCARPDLGANFEQNALDRRMDG